MAYSDEVLADSPVAYYRCNEASGLLQDSSGNARHCTASGGTVTYGVSGAIESDPTNNAVDFTGTQWFSSPDGAWFDFGDTFTYEFWIKRGTSGADQYIISKGSGAMQCAVQTTNGINFNVRGVGSVVTSSITIDETTDWHHVVYTKSGATSKIYIDRVDRTGTVTNQTSGNNAVALFIGARDDLNFLQSGSLDEIALYTTALSEARIFAHYDAAFAVAAIPLRSQHLDFDYSR